MNRKRIITLVLSFFVVVVICTYLIKYGFSAITGGHIKVMEYMSPTITGESGYQIDKYENMENSQWLDENEVLSLTKKGDFKNPYSTISVRYCSIYNLNTNEAKDFKNVDISDFLGVSPDKKYVLYAEPRVIPKSSSNEWKKALDSEDFFHENIKLLNLSTGEITDLNTEKNNYSAEFKWIGNNKILANYITHWAIIDINGKVYVGGNYNDKKDENARIAGTDDIKDLGDSVEGKFYYIQDASGRIETKVCSIDVKTNNVNTINKSNNYRGGSKKGKTIVMDNSNDNGEAVDGVFPNRTFGEIIMDEFGKVIRNIDLPKGIINSEYILSPDGTKAAYLEYPNDSSNSDDNAHNNTYLKVIDIKTGDVREIVKESNLKAENEKLEYINEKNPFLYIRDIDNICWSITGKELSFTYGNSSRNKNKINSYIVSFDK